MANKSKFKEVQKIAEAQGVSIERYKTSRSLYVVKLPGQEEVVVKFSPKIQDLLSYFSHNSFEKMVKDNKAKEEDIKKYESRYPSPEKLLQDAFENLSSAIQIAHHQGIYPEEYERILKEGKETIVKSEELVNDFQSIEQGQQVKRRQEREAS